MISDSFKKLLSGIDSGLWFALGLMGPYLVMAGRLLGENLPLSMLNEMTVSEMMVRVPLFFSSFVFLYLIILVFLYAFLFIIMLLPYFWDRIVGFGFFSRSICVVIAFLIGYLSFKFSSVDLLVGGALLLFFALFAREGAHHRRFFPWHCSGFFHADSLVTGLFRELSPKIIAIAPLAYLLYAVLMATVIVMDGLPAEARKCQAQYEPSFSISGDLVFSNERYHYFRVGEKIVKISNQKIQSVTCSAK